MQIIVMHYLTKDSISWFITSSKVLTIEETVSLHMTQQVDIITLHACSGINSSTLDFMCNCQTTDASCSLVCAPGLGCITCKLHKYSRISLSQTHCVFFSVVSTGLVRLYIAGLPLRSRPDPWATFCRGGGGGPQCLIFVFWQWWDSNPRPHDNNADA